MSGDEFTKLFKYVSDRFDKVDKSLETKASTGDMQNVLKMLDKVLKQQEIDNDERLVMGHQLDRLERWVHEVADKIGYKLTV
jgi:hypothetical protein